MESKRSFICLNCGNKVYVSREEYLTIKHDPVCPDCRNKKDTCEETYSESTSSYVTEGINSVLETAEKILSNSLHNINVNSKKQTTSDAIYIDENLSDRSVLSKREIFKNLVDVGINIVISKFSEMPVSSVSGVDDFAKWEHIGCLGDVYDNHREILTKYSHCVGLYMHKINGKIMYIGRAVEYANGGLRKRLSDYCRPNGSARKHPSGQKIHANRYRIQTYILVVGSDAAAAEKSKRLEEQYVGKYNPPWNDKLKTL